MTVALAGRAPATFEIKSATLPLVALLLNSPDPAPVAGELQARFGDTPDFFDHDPLVIDLATLPAGCATPDFQALLQLLRPYRVMPVAVKGGSEEQMEAARAAGLAAAPEAKLVRERKAETKPEAKPEPQAAVAAAPTPAVPQGGRDTNAALVIDKPLRSGQQVYARGRDVVVLAMVNAGAEVIADGHVHVYAPLRGRA